jgi:hypothetical protein
MPKLSEDEFRTKVARIVADGGWSSIVNLVDAVPIEDLRDQYSWIEDDEDEEDEEE